MWRCCRAVCGIQDVGSEMTFKPSSSSTSKFTDYARLYSTPFQTGQLSGMLPVGESVSVIEPCRDGPATADTPAISQSNHFEVTKNNQRPRLSSAYYDLGTGISKLKYSCDLAYHLCFLIALAVLTSRNVTIGNVMRSFVFLLGHLKPGNNVRPSVCLSVRPSVRTSIRPYVRLYVHMSTIKFNAATNQIVLFVKVNETFTTIWLSRSYKVRVKVTWDLRFQNDNFQILSPLPFFNQSKKFQGFLILDQSI